MKEYILFGILLVCLIILTNNYYTKINEKKTNEFRNELIDIDSYFYSDEYIKRSKKRKIWIHIPYDKNSRKWTNFGSRTSYDLNCSYIVLCIKSIIDTCGDSYDIIIIDDTVIPALIDTNIDLLKLSGALKTKYRELCLLQVLYKYGGVIVPPSLFLKESIKKIDDESKWYVVEIPNTTHVSYLNSICSTTFTGSSEKNSQLNKYIEYYTKEITNDFGEQSIHFNVNYMKQNSIPYLDGKLIGVKDKYNNVITLEELMEHNKILLDDNNIGLYIPHEQLLKRTKYNWFCALNFEELLKCKSFISYYMVSNT